MIDVTTRARAMARIQASYLFRNAADLGPELTVPQAVELIRDCLEYLDLPDAAVEVALQLHPVIERWGAWGAWDSALQMVLDSVPDLSIVIRAAAHKPQSDSADDRGV